MTENGLKEGDWVSVKTSGTVGKIVCAETYVACVERNRLVEEWFEDCGNLERIDRRTAFLAELKELLERYDARIYPCGLEIEGLGICFGDGKDEIRYDMYEYSPIHELNADNIMDFEKD